MKYFWRIWMFLNQWRTFRANCGHKTKLKGSIAAFGETRSGSCSISDNGEIQYCIGCIEKMVIPCAWCGNAIFPGDPLALFAPKPEYSPPNGSVTYTQDPLVLVGCLRQTCADGMDRSGFWVPPGQVLRVASPLELMLKNMEDGGDGMIIENDLGDIPSAIEKSRAAFPEQ